MMTFGRKPTRMVASVAKAVGIGCLVWASTCHAFDWSDARGFNVTSAVNERDIRFLKSLGASVIRVSFANDPLIGAVPPYANNEPAFARLDRIVEWANANRMAVVIDPHTAPGFANPYTTSPEDLFWRTAAFQDRLLALWADLSRRYADKTAQAIGFDLLNEPVTPGLATSQAKFDWNAYVARLVATIRRYDTHHTIIVEPARQPDRRGRYNTMFEALNALDLPPDANLVVSPHMYLPIAFTHQGVLPKYSARTHYPGEVEGALWNRDRLKATLAAAREYGISHRVPILIGEFSASVHSGDDGVRYLRDAIDVMNGLSLGWVYHAYKENAVWDPGLDAAASSARTAASTGAGAARGAVLLRGLSR
jgi:aryl-phospho-beta-D-glucosidase BglC (GH1 family)